MLRLCICLISSLFATTALAAPRKTDPVCFLMVKSASQSHLVIFDVRTQVSTVMAEGDHAQASIALNDLVASKHCRDGRAAR